jgi:hypothetical protein
LSGYVIGGYVLTIGSLLGYGLSVARRERSARRRARRARAPSALDVLLSGVEPEVARSESVAEEP